MITSRSQLWIGKCGLGGEGELTGGINFRLIKKKKKDTNSISRENSILCSRVLNSNRLAPTGPEISSLLTNLGWPPSSPVLCHGEPDTAGFALPMIGKQAQCCLFSELISLSPLGWLEWAAGCQNFSASLGRAAAVSHMQHWGKQTQTNLPGERGPALCVKWRWARGGGCQQRRMMPTEEVPMQECALCCNFAVTSSFEPHNKNF